MGIYIYFYFKEKMQRRTRSRSYGSLNFRGVKKAELQRQTSILLQTMTVILFYFVGIKV